MSCKKAKELIDLYLDGEADNQQKDLLFSHIKTCQKCGIKLDESQAFNNVIKSLPKIKHPDYLHKSIMSRIETEGYNKKIRIFPIMAWSGVVIIIMALAFSFILIKHEPKSYKIKKNVILSKTEMDQGFPPKINIVSPKEDSVIDNQYIDISAVLSLADTKNIRIILDGKDVTEETDISSDFLIYTSDAIEEGHHKVIIQAFDKKGKPSIERSWKFYVIPSLKASISKPSEISPS